MLGATYGGSLLRWEDTTGWRPVAAAPTSPVLDVAVAGTRALALAFPEALFASEDSGATWAPAGAAPIGAHRLGVNRAGLLSAQGLFRSLAWEPGGARSFSRSKRPLVTRGAAIDVEVGRGATASAVQTGRAAMDGDRYIETVRPDTEGDLWQLARGRIEGRLELVPLAWSGGCGSIRIGLRNKTVYAVCVSLDGADIAAAVRRSRDGGSTWSEPLSLVTPDTDQITVTVSPEGSALLSGVCKSGGEPSSCKPTSPLLVRGEAPAASPAPLASASAAPSPSKAALPDTKSSLKAMATGAPQLSGIALLPAFSFDGHSAYFLGHRGKDEKLTLFVSHDDGETFSQRSLETPGQKLVRRPRDYDDEEGPEEPVEDYIEVDETSTLHPGEDGTVGLMVIRYRGFTYVTTDEDGRVLHETPLPSDEMIMAGFGRRVVTLAARDVPWLSESSDGGATWDEQPAPAALGREISRGARRSPARWRAASSARRWRAWAGAGRPTSARSRSPEATPSSAPSVLTPIVCDLAATTRWTRIDHVVGGPRLPRLNEIMRGRSVWSVLTSDPATGATAALSASLPESGEGEAKITSRSLLGPRSASGRSATALSFQMEGYAAARAAIPVGKDGAATPARRCATWRSPGRTTWRAARGAGASPTPALTTPTTRRAKACSSPA